MGWAGIEILHTLLNKIKACFDVFTIKNAKFSEMMGYPWDKKTIFA